MTALPLTITAVPISNELSDDDDLDKTIEPNEYDDPTIVPIPATRARRCTS